VIPVAALLALAVTGPALAEGPDAPVMAPSGFDVMLHQLLFEEHPYSGNTMIVVRVLAPAIASPVLAANLQADMEWACETWGMPASQDLASPADRIVVELMAAIVPRGEPSPGTRRFFETYRPEDGFCIWELF
jgi:hypothetical protein